MIKYFCKNCNINVESSECSVCGARTEVESKLYWCSTCNIPIYDEVCPICGCKGEYFTSDARPVFPEERLLIEIMLGKPFCLQLLKLAKSKFGKKLHILKIAREN